MIRLQIEVLADTEDHFDQIIKDMTRSIQLGRKSVEAWYIWPNSFLQIKKEIMDDNA